MAYVRVQHIVVKPTYNEKSTRFINIIYDVNSHFKIWKLLTTKSRGVSFILLF